MIVTVISVVLQVGGVHGMLISIEVVSEVPVDGSLPDVADVDRSLISAGEAVAGVTLISRPVHRLERSSQVEVRREDASLILTTLLNHATRT